MAGKIVPITPPEQRLYIAFMQELKVRLGGIRAMLDKFSSVESDQGFFVAEACFLQMRFICELMALACIAAHEPIGLSRRLQDAWNADAVFAALEKLNPTSFPRPIKLTNKDGLKSFEVQPQTGMNRAELKKIYHECGHALHRGVFADALQGKPRHYDLDQLNRWGRALWELLREHMVYVPQLQQVFLIDMVGGPGGAVASAYAVSEDVYRDL